MTLNNSILSYLLILSLLILKSCNGAKMKDRFDWDLRKLRPLRFSFPRTTNQDTMEELLSGKISQYLDLKYIDNIFSGINFTFNLINGDKVGSPDEYGNYDGMIGVIQRNETDTANVAARYDATQRARVNQAPPPIEI